MNFYVFFFFFNFIGGVKFPLLKVLEELSEKSFDIYRKATLYHLRKK